MINTKRLLLRQFKKDDPPAENWIATDMCNFRKTQNLIFDYYHSYPNNGTGWLGIVEIESGNLIGRAGLLSRTDVFSSGELELGYVVEKQYRNKGFAKEAAKALLDYVVNHPLINRVYAGINESNEPSIKIADFIGLKKEYSKKHYGVSHTYYWYRKSISCKDEVCIHNDE